MSLYIIGGYILGRLH